jgi:hypothetical protein
MIRLRIIVGGAAIAALSCTSASPRPPEVLQAPKCYAPNWSEDDGKGDAPDAGKERETPEDQAYFRGCMQAVQRGGPALKACYEQALKRRSTLDGAALLRIEVLASGEVGRFKVIPEFPPDRALEICMAEAVCGWRFPRNPSGKPAIVEQTLTLTPVKSDSDPVER